LLINLRALPRELVIAFNYFTSARKIGGFFMCVIVG